MSQGIYISETYTDEVGDTSREGVLAGAVRGRKRDVDREVATSRGFDAIRATVGASAHVGSFYPSSPTTTPPQGPQRPPCLGVGRWVDRYSRYLLEVGPRNLGSDALIAHPSQRRDAEDDAKVVPVLDVDRGSQRHLDR